MMNDHIFTCEECQSKESYIDGQVRFLIRVVITQHKIQLVFQGQCVLSALWHFVAKFLRRKF